MNHQTKIQTIEQAMASALNALGNAGAKQEYAALATAKEAVAIIRLGLQVIEKDEYDFGVEFTGSESVHAAKDCLEHFNIKVEQLGCSPNLTKTKT